MAALRVPRKDIFLALSFGELHKLSGFPASDLRPFLPFLSSYLQLELSGDNEEEQDAASLQVARALVDLPAASQVLSYASANFQLLEEDARKEQRVLQKAVSDGARASTGSVLAQSVENGLCLEFERGDVERRFRLLLSEVLYLMVQQSEGKHVEASELLDCSALKWELSDMLCVAVGQMPGLLPVVPVAEAMLHCSEGTHMIVQLVANHPSYYQQVVSALVTKGDNHDEVTAMGRLRTAVLRHLCALHPVGTLSAQQLALESQKQPSLVLYLALDQVGRFDTIGGEGNPLSDPVVMTLHNIFVTGNDSVKEWFRNYIRLNQHKYRRMYTTALSEVRQHLMDRLRAFDSTQSSTVGIAAPKAEPMETSEELVGEGVVHETTEEDMDDDTSGERSQDKAHDDDRASMEEEFYPPPSSGPSLTDPQCSEVSVLLRVLCALKLTGLFVLRQEGSLVLRLMTHLVPPHTDRGVHLIKTMFAVLVACPFLVSNEKREEAVVRWFQWLIDNQNSYSRCGNEGAYGEMLLLAAIHFQEKRRSQIMEMVSGTLGFSLQHAVRPGKHSDIRELFLSVFTEDIVCTQALRVQPTVGLSGEMTGFYPIHCVYNLLKSQTFLKHSVAVTPWVMAQVMTAAEPLHPTLPQLIQELVPAILAPPTRSTYGTSNSGVTFRQSPITEQELLSVFRVTSDSTPSCATQLLLLYYVLLYHNTWLGNLKAYSAHLKTPPPTYSPHVLGSVPVKWLLQQARRRQSDYSVLYPALVKLVITHLPHVAMTTSGLGESCSVPVMRSSEKSNVTPEGVERVLQKIATAPARVAMVMQRLSQLEPSELIPLEPCLVSHLRDLLEGETPLGLQEAVAQLWQRLNTVMSKKLWMDTVNALNGSSASTGVVYTSEDLVEDPLLVLKCDPRVFRCAPLCEVVLCVLSAFLAASRAWVSEQAHVQSFTNKAFAEHIAVGDKDEACTSYCALQESAAVQILLDVCLTQQEDKRSQPFGPLLSVQREEVCLICSHLHQVFIGNPTVAKLVHFQGYPSSLIGMMVEGVPSMHICLDFISELLEQTQISQQQFGIQLASQVLAHYPLPSATDTAQLLLKKLHTLLAEVPRQAHTDLFIPVLPFLVTLCQSFPPLSEETTRFLLKLGRQHLLAPSQPPGQGERAADKQGIKEFLSSVEGGGEERGQPQEQHLMLLAVQQTFKQLAEKAIIKF